jgi:hypothetical protein
MTLWKMTELNFQTRTAKALKQKWAQILLKGE